MILLHKARAFTLIELVMVIVILGVLSTVLVNLLREPLTAYVDIQRRAELVGKAETALQRMTREIRLALPNSIRATTTSIEFLRTIDGGRYRGKGTNRLKFNKQSDQFEFLGPLNDCAAIGTGAGGQSTCMAANSVIDCMVVFNTGQAGANAYAGNNIATITASNCGASTLDFDLTPVLRFPYQSARQRFYIVDTPVSFICASGNITRYSDYQILTSTVPTSGTANLLIDNLTACDISYDPGNSTRAALATISLTITEPESGESVSLLQQAHVDNQP